jgi:malonyl-ACP decarboxylase
VTTLPATTLPVTTLPAPAKLQPVAVTGAGVVCAIAGNLNELATALRQGHCGISAYHHPDAPSISCAATLRDFSWRDNLEPLLGEYPDIASRARKVLNNNTPSASLNTCAAVQAVIQAGYGADSGAVLDNTGIIVAGNNLDQAFIAENWHRFRNAETRINPKYAITFQDSNHIGTLSEILAIRGPGCTIGAASASGNAALFNAMQWI